MSNAAVLFTCVALIGLGRFYQGTRTPPVAASEYFDLYEQGQHEEVARVLNRAATERSFATFKTQADRWIQRMGPQDVSRRRIVAATVALEIAHTLREEPPYLGADFLVWASLLMREANDGPSDVERLWQLAAIAGMQELDSPWALSAGLGGSGGGSLTVSQHEAMRGGGQLALAADRYPGEPRFALGQLAAQESIATIWDSAPPFMAFVQAHSAASVVQNSPLPEPQNAAFVRNQAADILARRARIPTIIQEYRALDVHEALRPEVALHIGYLEGVLERWPQALAELRRVGELTTDPVLCYLSYLFAGRIAQVVGDTAGATAAFEAA